MPQALGPLSLWLQKLLSSVYYSWATGSIYNAMSCVGEAAETFLPSSWLSAHITLICSLTAETQTLANTTANVRYSIKPLHTADRKNHKKSQTSNLSSI